MIARLAWWLLTRALGDGVRMSDETYEAILAAIREDAEAMGL